MEALAQLTSVTIRRLPRGKLAIHEEFPDLERISAGLNWDSLAGLDS